MRINTLPLHAETIAPACAIALGFALPISVAADNILLGLLLVVWLAAGGYHGKWNAIKAKMVANTALLLFGLLTLGLAYGERYAGDGVRYWAKYLDLLFIPIFITAFQNQETRKNALKALGGALLASLVVSFFSPLGVLYGNPMVPPNDVASPVGFKYSITQSLLIAFGAFTCIVVARETTSRNWRIVLTAIAVVSSFNVLFVVISRTGYVVLAALLLYFFIAQYRWRGLALGAIAGTILFTAGYAASGVFHQRVDTVVTEMRAWNPDETSSTSIGMRMDFYRRSLKIISEHPLFGAGTGSFPAAYAATSVDRHIDKAVNPHNEYLLIAAQIGLVGLACLLYLFYTQWRLAARLEPLYRDLARGLVIMFAIGCLFNSLLLDHTEGLFFAWMTGLCFSEMPAKQSTGGRT